MLQVILVQPQFAHRITVSPSTFIVALYTTLSCLPRGNMINVIIFTKINSRWIMKPLKEKISITIDSDLLEKLKAEAEKDDRSLSQFINLILRKYLKSHYDD